MLELPGCSKPSTRVVNKLDRFTGQSEEEREARRGQRAASRRLRVNHAGRDRRMLRKQRELHRGLRRRCIKRAAALSRATAGGKQKQGDESARGHVIEARHTRNQDTLRASLAVIPSGPVSYTILDILSSLTRTPLPSTVHETGNDACKVAFKLQHVVVVVLDFCITIVRSKRL